MAKLSKRVKTLRTTVDRTKLYGIDVSSDHDYLALAERWRPVRAWATVLIRATAERSVTAS